MIELNPASDAGVWDAAEAIHMRHAVLGAAMCSEPSPYVYVENVFSPAAYAAIERSFPTDSDAFRRWSNPGEPSLRFGNYEQRREIEVPREALALPPAQRDFWTAMAALVCGPHFARTLLERFEPYARARFGAQIDDPSFVEQRLPGNMILNQHDAGYYLGPHTDRSEKVFTCLFYFPEHEGLDHLGTTLYTPLQRRDFTCSGLGHYDPARFERGETIPYRPNSALIFARTDVMFHGVHALTEQELMGSRRRGIQMQFWLRNTRPREQCKTTFAAAMPATMPAGGEAFVPYELTNRATTELGSSLPYPTQLGYRWLDDAGAAVETSSRARSGLPAPLAAGETRGGSMRVVAPSAPGRYLLRLSVVQEGVGWFDDFDPNNGATQSVTVWGNGATTIASPSDIFAETNAVALGDGWFPFERHDDVTFRWVENDAVVHVAALTPLRHILRLLVEPGPGVAHEPFELTARFVDGAEIGRDVVSTKQMVEFALPPESPRVFSIVLHAGGGGRSSPNDPRVLNFRVFELSVERVADVFPAWANAERGFYPLERHANTAFRWVGGDATIAIHRAHGHTLSFEAESGPGFKSKPFTLHVAGPDGTDIAATEIASRTKVDVPLAPFGDAVTLTLHADGGGHAVDGDPRALDFRIFAAS